MINKGFLQYFIHRFIQADFRANFKPYQIKRIYLIHCKPVNTLVIPVALYDFNVRHYQKELRKYDNSVHVSLFVTTLASQKIHCRREGVPRIV